LLIQKIDARHFSPEDLRSVALPPGADPAGVSIFYLVSAFPSPEREHADSIGKQVREVFPHAYLVKLFCPGVTAPAEGRESAGSADQTASSLVQAIDICTSWQKARNQRCLPPGPQSMDVLRAGS
jgi:predicted RNase H-like nuclease